MRHGMVICREAGTLDHTIYIGNYSYTLIIDANWFTGWGEQSNDVGVPYDGYIIMSSTLKNDYVNIHLFNRTSSSMVGKGYTGPVSVDGKSLETTIPFNALNMTGDKIVFTKPYSYTYFYDYIWPKDVYKYVSIGSASIVVDGDKSDWESQGVAPIFVDIGDNTTIPYQGLNITRVYMAIDNNTGLLYLGVELGGPVNNRLLQEPHGGGYSVLALSYRFKIDVDNDDNYDYEVRLYVAI